MGLEYSDVDSVLNNYNLTGAAQGTTIVSGISLGTSGGRHVATYTHFEDAGDVAAASYYDISDVEATYVHANYNSD